MSRIPVTSGDWRDQAACLDQPHELFWPEPVNGKLTAGAYDAGRRICAGCPVRADCLDYAIEHRENHGLWGGLTPNERQRHARQTGRSTDTVCARPGCDTTFPAPGGARWCSHACRQWASRNGHTRSVA